MKNRCLFLATETEASSGGVGYYNDCFIQGLEKDFFESVIVCGTQDKLVRESGIKLPLENNTLPKKIVNALILCIKLLFTRVDTIICAHVFLMPLALIFSFFRNSKIILIVYGIDCWGGRLEKYKLFYNRIKLIVSISEFTTDQLLVQDFPAEKIVKIPPMIDFSNTSEEIAREDGEVCKILTVGRMSTVEKYKGHREVLKSVALLSERQIKFHYHIAGSGDDLPALKEMAKQLKIEDFITFHGFVSDEKLNELYKQCHIFVMPSQVSTLPHDLKGEGFGIVFVEAAKQSMAVIGPNSGGSDDIIFHEKTGMAINPESPIEIADAIQKLSQDTALREKLGHHLYLHCKSLFSLDKRKEYINLVFGDNTNA